MHYQPFYEVAVWSAGEWRVTDSISDKGEAMGLARKILHETSAQGVQVNEERFDPTSELFYQRVLFRRQPEARRLARHHAREVDPVRRRRSVGKTKGGGTILTGLTGRPLVGSLLIVFAASRVDSLITGL